MKDLIAMSISYAKRSTVATLNPPPDATIFEIAHVRNAARTQNMAFDRYDFLTRVRAKARTQKAVLDILDLPSSRGKEVFDPEHPKARQIKVEEAVALSEAFGVPIGGAGVSVGELVPVLSVCLRNAPAQWDDASVRRLAEEIALGLRFQQSFGTAQPGQYIPGAEGVAQPK